MTNLLLSRCDCSMCVKCGINNSSSSFASFCNTITDSPCASTLTLTGTIPEFVVPNGCGGVLYTMPAYSFTLTMQAGSGGSNNCAYNAVQVDQTISITTNCCAGECTDWTWTERSTSAIMTASAFPWALLTPCFSPCTPLCLEPPDDYAKCCGIWLGVVDTWNDGGSQSVEHYYTYAFKDNEISDCDDECACLNGWVSGTGTYQLNSPASLEVFGVSLT